jgi:hypothetical protein
VAEKTATFAIDLQGNVADVAKRDSAELETLRAKIEASQNAIKGLSQSYRSLKGSSDEIAAAKSGLKAKLDAEKGTISQATLALVKQGTSYTHLTAEAKKAASTQDKIREGLKAAGGPLSELTSKFDALKETLGGAGAGMTGMAIGAGLLVAAVVAVGAAVGAAAVKVSEFVVSSANQLRAMSLTREAASGSAANAAALGTQVDDLSHKLATSKERLNEMGSAITKNMSGGLSKAGGEAIENEFYAVAEASAAMGDEVGNTLKGLVERGKQFNRFTLSPQDLMGTQVQFQEVAGALAKNLGIGLEQAKGILFTKGVDLKTGTKALRDAVEKNFGDVNAKKLLDLDVQMLKVKEHLVGLTSGVMLEPLLKGLDKVLSLFDDTTVAGNGLKAIFTSIGDVLGAISPDVFDMLQAGLEESVEAGLDLALGIKSVNDELKHFGFDQGLWGAFKIAIKGLGEVALFALGPVGMLVDAALELKGLFGAAGAAGGKSMAEGLIAGLKDPATLASVAQAAAGLGDVANAAIVAKQQIHSPSKVWEEYGRQTGEGYAGGLEDSAPRAQSAADRLSPGAPGGGGGGGGAQISFNMILNLPESMAKENATQLAAAMTSPSILGQITRALREAMVTGGIPTQAAPAP